MPSPFPGMDPYLEAYWGDIHTRLMANASRQINAVLPDDMQARVEEGLRVTESGVREGDFVLAVPEEPIPVAYRTPYRICVRRASDLQRIELYRASLREPLPNIPIPLRPSDADIVLQLQPLIDECYHDGRYEQLNYRDAPRPSLSADDAVWAEETIRNAGLGSAASPRN
jgi:hypothetical protein